MNAFELAEKINTLAEEFDELSKASPEIRTAMQGLRSAAKAGAIDPKHVEVIRRGLFTDRMTGHVMGNKAAHEDFLASPGAKGGVHILMDGNDFGTINKMHGMELGDQAIQHFGRAIREAVDESVGQKKSKLFRVGGDEFHLHVPSHDHALRFVRTVREKLRGLVPVGGTHKLSMAIGIGHTPHAADAAQRMAKEAKKAKQYPVGQAETHAHSLFPGKEGALPTEETTPPLRLAVR